MALTVGVPCVSCATSLGRMCTWSGEGAAGSGLLVTWAVALRSNFVGSGLRLGFWGSSTALLKVMGRLLHFSVYNASPLWCQSGTLPLDSVPLDEHVVDWQALKLNIVECQFSHQGHFEAHPIFGSESSP